MINMKGLITEGSKISDQSQMIMGFFLIMPLAVNNNTGNEIISEFNNQINDLIANYGSGQNSIFPDSEGQEPPIMTNGGFFDYTRSFNDIIDQYAAVYAYLINNSK